MKKSVTCLLAIILLMTSCISAFANNDVTFGIWTDNNRYAGDEEAATLASKLDRANLAYIIVEAFDIDMKYEMEIKDVDSAHWAYPYICAVAAKGIMPLDEGRFFPDEYITREEIPQYFKFLNISYPPIASLPFLDIEDVDEAYKNLFYRFVTAGYLKAVSDEYIFPKRIITLTETVSMLNAMFPNIPNKVLKKTTYDGHFLLSGDTTYLSDVVINGDLIITEGVITKNKDYEGNNVTLNNVEVKGNIYIMGNSLTGQFILENVKASDIVAVGKDPIIISFEKCDFKSFQISAKLANIVSDKAITIKRK